MPLLVVTGARMQCTFGAAPSTLVVAMPQYTSGNKPIANIHDHLPNSNVPPFGTCSSLQNPQVQAATAAALGVLTPQPCVPVTTSPWSGGATVTQVRKAAAVTMSCKLTCNWGGSISIVDPGQAKVDVK